MAKRDQATNPGVARPLLVNNFPQRSPAGIIDMAMNMIVTAWNMGASGSRQGTEAKQKKPPGFVVWQFL
ncbi:hypothetical protein [Pseudophaeobacter sp. C1-32P7]|jgi:hypothetical protein|uniref:hypothetical protein n=1 Tax=Pseudophaeobacter sp. C1-32P7 TaxID=3098142 RepID=UPI0034D710E6